MNSGFVYRNVSVYRIVMRLLYGSGYHRKYQAVADLIPPGASVVDICAGDCKLADKLVGKGTLYVGLELNPSFVAWAQRRGIDARVFDARTEEIPVADVICIQSSLYQFLPEDGLLVKRMIQSARKLVIISEPVVNLASSTNSLISRVATQATSVNGKRFPRRHSLESLIEMLNGLRPQSELIERQKRDALFVIRTETQRKGI